MSDKEDVFDELGIALLNNSGAMDYFMSLNDKKQRNILQAANFIETKQEMKNFIANLAGFY